MNFPSSNEEGILSPVRISPPRMRRGGAKRRGGIRFNWEPEKHVSSYPKQNRKRSPRRSGDLPLGAALRRERRAAHRFPGGDSVGVALGGLVQRLVGARRDPRGDGQQGARRGLCAFRRSAFHARGRVLSLRQVPFRQRHGADEGGAPEGGRMPQQGAAAPRSARGARRDSLRG